MTAPQGQPPDPGASPAVGPSVARPRWPGEGGAPALALRLSRVAERPEAVLLGCVLVAVAVSLWATRGQTFFSDEWGRLLRYGDSVDGLLRGYSGHLVVLHALLYKAIFATVGADSYLPFRVIEAALIGICGLLFYAVARTRARPWPCVAATIALLFLGSAFEVTATPYGIVILLPMAFGLAALLCLQRFPADGDPLACLLLIAAVASHSLGLAFVAGAAVVLAQQKDHSFPGRAWVFLVPGLLYAAWFAWSRLTASPASFQVVHLSNIGEVPSAVLGVAAAGLSGVSGLFGSSGFGNGLPFNLEAGYLLLGLLVAATAWRVLSGRPLAREVWVPVALALTFWALIGMVSSAARPPQASRYIYPSAAFLLLIVLELTRDVRPTRPIVAVAAGALVVSVVPNLVNLVEQARQIREFAATERSELGALELAHAEAPAAPLPRLAIHNGVLGVGSQGAAISPWDYQAAVDRYGSPADGPAQIAAAGETDRETADQVLLAANDITVSGLPAAMASAWRDCAPPVSGSGARRSFPVPRAGLAIRPDGARSRVTVAVRRFGVPFQRLDPPRGSGPLVLRPAKRQLAQPWTVEVTGATLCSKG